MGEKIVYPRLPRGHEWVVRSHKFPLPKYHGEIAVNGTRYRTWAYTARGFNRALKELAIQVWAMDYKRRSGHG